MSQEDPGIAELVRLATNFAIAHGWRQTKIWKNPEHGDLPIFEANIHDTVREVTPVHLDLNHNLIVWQEFGKSEQFAIPLGPESSIPPAPPPAHNGPAPPAPAPTHHSHHGEPSSSEDPRLGGFMQGQEDAWRNQYIFNDEVRKFEQDVNTREEQIKQQAQANFEQMEQEEREKTTLEENAMQQLKDSFQEQKKLEQNALQQLKDSFEQQKKLEQDQIQQFRERLTPLEREIRGLAAQLEKTQAAREAQQAQPAPSQPQLAPSQPQRTPSQPSRGRQQRVRSEPPRTPATSRPRSRVRRGGRP